MALFDLLTANSLGDTSRARAVIDPIVFFFYYISISDFKKEAEL